MSAPRFDPPSGWYFFGTHAAWDAKDRPDLEFSGVTDETGMPLWERPRRLPEEQRLYWEVTAGRTRAYCGHDPIRAIANYDAEWPKDTEVIMQCTIRRTSS